jgi:TRAP-type transport system periplasmic protein
MKSSNMSIKAMFIVTGLLLMFQTIVFGKTIKIKLGTFAPKETFWVKDLQKMGNEWKKLTKNKVRLRIYPSGVAGDEPAMAAKLRAGQLSAASLTVLGLQEFIPETLVFSTPFLFNNDNEVRFVMSKILPELEERFEEKGYKVLHWSTLGWIYLFSKEKVSTPKELKNLKLYVDSAEGSDVYKKAGFQSEQFSRQNLFKNLSIDMVSAYTAAPIYSLAFQWFGVANHMMDYPLSPALAATIVRKDKWDAIDQKYHEAFLKSAHDIGKNAEVQILKFDSEAKKIMVEKSLKINPLTQIQKKVWQEAFLKAYPVIREKVSKKLFDKVVQLLVEYRKTN